MKRTITLITLIVFASLGTRSIAVANSKLHLDLFTDGQFVVQLDGIRYDHVRNGLDIGGLNPGTHRIKIIEVFRGRAYRNHRRSVLYNGTINIPFRSTVFARLTPHLQLRITEIRRISPPRRYVRKPRSRNNRGYRGNRRYNDNDRRYNYNNRRYREFQPLHDAFVAAKTEMVRSAWDKDKLVIARSFAKKGISSSELASLMGLLTFEKSKLELAKFGYKHTRDSQNFYLVNDAFTYDSSVRELDKFIRKNRRN